MWPVPQPLSCSPSVIPFTPRVITICLFFSSIYVFPNQTTTLKHVFSKSQKDEMTHSRSHQEFMKNKAWNFSLLAPPNVHYGMVYCNWSFSFSFFPFFTEMRQEMPHLDFNWAFRVAWCSRKSLKLWVRYISLPSFPVEEQCGQVTSTC